MIKRNDEHTVAVMEKVFGGEGAMHSKKIIDSPEELYGKGRVFNIVTLEPDCGLGWHIHKGDGEFYHILSGEGEYSDNGNIVTLRAGDTAFCPDGEGHCMVNRGTEPLVFIALIIYN